jgi:hypothetical protein
MASWSLLAISAASDSATPNTNDQVRRRLTASSCCAGGCGGVGGACDGRAAARQFAHDAGALLGADPGPARNLVDRARAADNLVRASSVRTLTQGLSIILGLFRQ